MFRNLLPALCLGWSLGSAAPVSGQAAGAAVVADEPIFRIRRIELRGVTGRTLTTAELMDCGVELRRRDDGVWVSAEVDESEGPVVMRTLGRITEREAVADRFDATAIRAIAGRVLRAYVERQVGAVRVDVMRASIAELSADGTGVLVLRVTEGRLKGVAAIKLDKNGQPIEVPGQRFDRIRANSPLRSDDPVQLEQINRYVAWLNRHPGRRVNASLGTDDEGELVLEYIVDEQKPWSVYVQASNTGTASTTRWRQRVGVVHNNLTGNDDIVSIDYITGNFDDVHAITGSYDTPLSSDGKLRGRVFGTWSRYQSSQFGITALSFSGDAYTIGGEIKLNVWQHETLFVDAFAAMRFEDTSADNETAMIFGRSNFFLPSAGVRLDDHRAHSSINGSLSIEGNLPGLAGTDQVDLPKLGRALPDRAWQTVKASASTSFFLEPLLFDDFAKRGQAPSHELLFSVRGQHVLGDDRTPPSYTQTIGGFYSVRGYRESLIAADDVIAATAEYRLHIPRLFDAGEPGELFGDTFHWRPREGSGYTDWDWLLRGFIDYGRASHNNRQVFEQNVTLLGAGVGTEVRIRNNVSARVDFAWALIDANTGSDIVEAGTAKIHLSFTIAY